IAERNLCAVRPAAYQSGAFSLPVTCKNGSLTAIFADRTQGKKTLRVLALPGEYTDLWTGETVVVSQTGETSLPAEDGVVLLWKSN
ncbi:MAG: hypothetical protein J1E06_00350, partial [Acutalibacter sp.]|nr:hypothetical protein [Acutalibacter sp.]